MEERGGGERTTRRKEREGREGKAGCKLENKPETPEEQTQGQRAPPPTQADQAFADAHAAWAATLEDIASSPEQGEVGERPKKKRRHNEEGKEDPNLLIQEYPPFDNCFFNVRKEGQCRIRDMDGDEGVYEGQLDSEGRAEGKGRLQYDEGLLFVGRFSKGIQQKGVLYHGTIPVLTMRGQKWEEDKSQTKKNIAHVAE